MDIYDDLFDNLFPEVQLKYLNHVSPNSIDIEELKKLGYVTINRTEENGVVTENIHFVSFDKETNFTKIISYLLENEQYAKIKGLNEQMNAAVKVEDYMKAARIKKIKDEILNTPKK